MHSYDEGIALKGLLIPCSNYVILKQNRIPKLFFSFSLRSLGWVKKLREGSTMQVRKAINQSSLRRYPCI